MQTTFAKSTVFGQKPRFLVERPLAYKDNPYIYYVYYLRYLESNTIEVMYSTVGLQIYN